MLYRVLEARLGSSRLEAIAKTWNHFGPVFRAEVITGGVQPSPLTPKSFVGIAFPDRLGRVDRTPFAFSGAAAEKLLRNFSRDYRKYLRGELRLSRLQVDNNYVWHVRKPDWLYDKPLIVVGEEDVVRRQPSWLRRPSVTLDQIEIAPLEKPIRITDLDRLVHAIESARRDGIVELIASDLAQRAGVEPLAVSKHYRQLQQQTGCEVVPETRQQRTGELAGRGKSTVKVFKLANASNQAKPA
jgi:hypothetical protein